MTYLEERRMKHASFWRYGKQMLCEDCALAAMEVTDDDGLNRFHPMTHEQWVKMPHYRRICDWAEDHAAMHQDGAA